MKKIAALFIVMMLISLIGCGSNTYRQSSATSETLFVNVSSNCWQREDEKKYTALTTEHGTLCPENGSESIDNPLKSQSTGFKLKHNPEAPYVSKESSCWWGEARGKYTVSATGYGILCSGNGYCDKSKAMANPLEIQSAGYDIIVTLADDNAETVTLEPGDTKLISCDSGSFNGYLYVIINPSTETERTETSELNSKPEAPYVSKESSCWWGEARGKYTISVEGYGTLCSGNGYCDKSKAISNPLQIQSEGCEILVTLSDDTIETVTMVAGDTQLISCKSGAFKGYLYVIIV